MAARELTEILLRGYESKDLDYKAPAEWKEAEKKACCELVKDILGMANTKGGYLVIGVREVPIGFSFVGLTESDAEWWDTSRLNRFLQNYADPPINTLLRKVIHDDKTYVIIEVPQFSDTPHICQKDFPGVLASAALYVRTDNNETAPIRSAADFRNVVEQALRNRSDALLASVRSILLHGSGTESPEKPVEDQFLNQRSDAVAAFDARNPYKQKDYTGYREIGFVLNKFEPHRFTLDRLRTSATHASVDFAGWPFLFIHSNRPDVIHAFKDGLETLIAFTGFNGGDRLDFWRYQESGFFYRRSLMWEESIKGRRGSGPRVADLGATVRYVAEGLFCLSKLYDGLLNDDDEITVNYPRVDAV